MSAAGPYCAGTTREVCPSAPPTPLPESGWKVKGLRGALGGCGAAGNVDTPVVAEDVVGLEAGGATDCKAQLPKFLLLAPAAAVTFRVPGSGGKWPCNCCCCCGGGCCWRLAGCSSWCRVSLLLPLLPLLQEEAVLAAAAAAAAAALVLVVATAPVLLLFNMPRNPHNCNCE